MKIKANVPRAIVKLPKLGGHGVLVLGDHYVEKIDTQAGKIKASPMIVEPVTDIAALGCPDGQVFYEEAEAFENFCATTKPIPLAKTRIRCRQPFVVRVHDKDGTWIKGVAEIFDESSPMLWITSETEIKGGASGGPILNLEGELVAIVSNSSSLSEGKSTSLAPRPLKALPVWVCKEIANGLIPMGD